VQELNQLIGINADDRFSGNFGSSSNLAGNSPFPLKAPILGGRFEKGRV